jgi:hypothetical protein
MAVAALEAAGFDVVDADGPQYFSNGSFTGPNLGWVEFFELNIRVKPGKE